MLDYLLSNNEQMVSVGELLNLNDHLNRKGIGREWNWCCSCGRQFEECPFWSKVMNEYENTEKKQLSKVETKHLPEKRFVMQLLHTVLISCMPSDHLKKEMQEYLCYDQECVDIALNSLRIIDYISSVSDKNIIVESSKLPHRLLALLKSKKTNCCVKVIHLVRDARAVTFSKVRRAEKRGKRQSFFLAMLGWVIVNLQILNVKPFIKEVNYIRVKYEDVCAEPLETIKNICEHLSLPFDKNMTELNRNGKHNIGGSTRRFETATDVKLDERWKSNMTFWRRCQYYCVGFFLNKRMGY
jgi:hypothetical protein